MSIHSNDSLEGTGKRQKKRNPAEPDKQKNQIPEKDWPVQEHKIPN